MALIVRRLFCVLLILLNECPPCFADDADPSVWDVKDDIKFGVAEPNLEVRHLCWCVCFAGSAGAHKQVKFSRKFTNSRGRLEFPNR